MKRNQQPKAKRGYSAKFLNLKIDFLANYILRMTMAIMSLFKKKK